MAVHSYRLSREQHHFGKYDENDTAFLALTSVLFFYKAVHTEELSPVKEYLVSSVNVGPHRSSEVLAEHDGKAVHPDRSTIDLLFLCNWGIAFQTLIYKVW